jgi:hypothetical protein
VSAHKQASEDIDDFINNLQETATEMVLVSRKNRGKKRRTSAPTVATFCTVAKKAAVADKGKMKATSLQLSIDATVQHLQQFNIRRNNQTRLQMTIGKLKIALVIIAVNLLFYLSLPS